jgi:putative cell wall-binding protein
MNRLRSIAIEEQRQLITFGFAVAVFLLTLLALQVQGVRLNRINGANRYGTSSTMPQASAASLTPRTVALAGSQYGQPATR